ncbi:MAG: ABC transporter ATP-binding protein [Candidatus Korarchaeota archaeon]|nr:ABC transporter ATP-binding protein [Candidatus Korarchaeota archaeon]NIU84550.1 ATP-binding cassette domain-containing protein [Candidatus Thorarchaeota archaeon]NIW14617.1 ATP-binding cassette domain-containing protein [Candidatus Thorarchaeota archaeon]NIW52690.1 ATP-binding cassette domain-containing protein [Candidatus Korarchaeota archaeon]
MTTIGLPLRIHKEIDSAKELEEEVAEVLKMVGLPPEEYMLRTSGELGGGEAQLVAIARALAVDPSLVIFDEPTSALDVSIQSKVLRILLESQKELNLTGIFITHDLSVVRNVSDRVAIMYLGNLYELGPTAEVFKNPAHPYTQMLFSSIPVITEEEAKMKPKRVKSVGEIPSPVNPPSGCRFHPRCPFAGSECSKEEPKFCEISEGHFCACHQ